MLCYHLNSDKKHSFLLNNSLVIETCIFFFKLVCLWKCFENIYRIVIIPFQSDMYMLRDILAICVLVCCPLWALDLKIFVIMSDCLILDQFSYRSYKFHFRYPFLCDSFYFENLTSIHFQKYTACHTSLRYHTQKSWNLDL